MSKPKVGFCWFASCGGCEEAVVDLDEAILDVVNAVDIVLWPCAMDFKYEDVEAMADGEMAVCFVNGAIRTSEEEEVAHLLRRKSQLLIAFGSCAHLGGIPGMGNFYSRDQILRNDFIDGFCVVNPDKVLPASEVEVPEGVVTLPEFLEVSRTMNQTVPVDYYLPGCPPPVRLIQGALHAILTGSLPEKGSVLAPDKALCEECPRKDTKPDKMTAVEFKRPHQVLIDAEKCLLAQNLLCLGPVTRAGCEGACTTANMPCTGCLGPTSHVRDYGAKALSAMASILEAKEENDIDKALDSIVDPWGTFNRYSFASSFMHSALHKGNGNGNGK